MLLLFWGWLLFCYVVVCCLLFVCCPLFVCLFVCIVVHDVSCCWFLLLRFAVCVCVCVCVCACVRVCVCMCVLGGGVGVVNDCSHLRFTIILINKSTKEPTNQSGNHQSTHETPIRARSYVYNLPWRAGRQYYSCLSERLTIAAASATSITKCRETRPN